MKPGLITKEFIWNDTKPGIKYRPGTSDEAIIKAVLVEQREYMFPPLEPRVVFDIGGNMGVVAVILANFYPNAKIYSFEPVRENFELLAANVSHYPNVTALHYGLGGDSGTRRIWVSDDPTNLGGFSVAIKNSEGKGELVSIKDIASVVQEFGVPDVVKIDVEGAEAEIFDSMPNLERVKWITGELHGIRDFQILDHLSRHFHIQCARNFSDKVWHFQAASRTWIEDQQRAIDPTQRP